MSDRASGRLRHRRAKDPFAVKDCCFMPLSREFVAVCVGGGMVTVTGADTGCCCTSCCCCSCSWVPPVILFSVFLFFAALSASGHN